MGKNGIDTVNFVVILTTFILFVLALFFKGFTHDILLEAGVFLISVKLIIAMQINNRHAKDIKAKLDQIDKKLK